MKCRCEMIDGGRLKQDSMPWTKAAIAFIIKLHSEKKQKCAWFCVSGVKRDMSLSPSEPRR